MSSSTLPGRVLSDIEGKPMILRQLERISAALAISKLVVAKSQDVFNDLVFDGPRRNQLPDLLEKPGLFVNRLKNVHVK